MLPCLAMARRTLRAAGPCRWLVCVNVAATFRRGGCSSISGSNFFSSGCADDLSLSIKPLQRGVDLFQLGRRRPRNGDFGGTGAGGPMTTGAKPPRPPARHRAGRRATASCGCGLRCSARCRGLRLGGWRRAADGNGQ